MAYIILFIYLTLISLVCKLKIPKELHILIFLVSSTVLILFAGLRGNIEPDYSNYLDIFQNSNTTAIGINNVEWGYLWINQMLFDLGLPFQFLVFTMAVLSIASKTYFFQRYSPNFGFSLLIYFSALFFLFDFIAIRQALALSVFMLSIPLIYQGRFWVFLILMLLASLIHISALLLIPCYFIFRFNFSKTTLFATVVICAIVNILKIRIPLVEMLLAIVPIPEFSALKLAVYLTQNDYAFVAIKQILLALLFISMKTESNKHNQMLNTLIVIFVFGILFATLFNGLPQLSYRSKWYFLSAEAILMVYFVDFVSRGERLTVHDSAAAGIRSAELKSPQPSPTNLKITFCLYGLLILLYAYSLFNFLNEIAARGDYIFPYRFFFQ